MFHCDWRFDGRHPLIRDHCIDGNPVIPFALWLVKCQEAIAASQGGHSREFKDFVVHEFLSLPANESLTVRFSGNPQSPTAGQFDVRRLGEDETASTPIVKGSWETARPAETLSEETGSQSKIDGAQFYRTAAAAGLVYGQLLRRLTAIEVRNEEWLAELAALDVASDPVTELVAAWDALLQCGAVLAGQGSACWIPFRIECVRFHEQPLESSPPPTRIAGQWLTNRISSEGRRIANVRGFPAGSSAPCVEFLGVHYALRNIEQHIAARPRRLETGGPKQILARLRSAAPQECRELLVQFLEEELLTVLQWDGDRRGDLSRGLVEVGMDSVTSVELQFRLQTALKFALKPSHPLPLQSVNALADFLLERHLVFS